MPSTKIPNYYWTANNLPVPTAEYKFHPSRRWRIDYCYPDILLAIEIEGAIWQQGRHTRGSGFVKDMEKYNALTEAGYHLLRYPPNKLDYNQIKSVFDNLRSLRQALEKR
jgi:very-short-patch-repair endonuclease